MPAERLAAMIWADVLPPTWPAALRGVVRSLRTALAPVGGDGQRLIETVPSGYRFAPSVVVDVAAAAEVLRQVAAHAAAGRHRAACDIGQPLTRLYGDRLLVGEDSEWLRGHRMALDALALRAAELVATAWSALGDHHLAIETARAARDAQPLEERTHRLLITVLDQAGDRAGAARAYERCRATLADELGIDPSAETVAVYLDAIRDSAAAPSARLPVSPSSFVGRAAELVELTAALARPGLIAVTGPGGVGKSRLAQHAAAAVDFPGGRSWLPLAAVTADELVATSLVLQLGIDVGAHATVEELVHRLAPVGRALLVLDGCEAVTDGVGSVAAALLAACPSLTLLVTSRIPLAVDGEQILVLEPLPPPDPSDLRALGENPQVQILRDRVRDEGGELRLDASNAPLVSALCRRCGGLPLALELAAAQLTALPVGDLVDQLDQLEAAPDDELRAMARSSYAMLGAEEATVFRRLGVLDGPVGLPLVRAVVAGPDVAPVRVVRILRELSARGLISVDRGGPRWSYQQDDDLHRFARELLASEGGERAVFDRLADAIRALLPEDAARPPAPFADEVTAVLGSIRSLFGASLDGRADLDRCLELAFRLHRYWTATTVAEGRFWLSRLLAAAPHDSLWRKYATYALGYLSYWSSATDDAVQDLQAAVAMFGAAPDPFVARAYIYLAGLLDDQDRSAEALHYVHRAIAAAEPFGTDLYVAAAMGIGSVLSERCDPDAARYAADAVARCRVDGSADQLGVLLPTAAMVCWQVGVVGQARAYVDEARPMHRGGKRIARVVLLSVSAALALGDGDVDAAVEIGAIADAEASELGVEREIPLIRSVLARALLAAGDVVGAAERALAAIDSTATMTVGFRLAICLETAALIGHAATADSQDIAALLAGARRLRVAGDRPAPPALRAEVERVRERVGAGTAPADPAALARWVLQPVSVAAG